MIREDKTFSYEKEQMSNIFCYSQGKRILQNSISSITSFPTATTFLPEG